MTTTAIREAIDLNRTPLRLRDLLKRIQVRGARQLFSSLGVAGMAGTREVRAVAIEVRTGAGRATRRLLGVWVIGAFAIAFLLIPLVARGSSGSPSAISELVLVVVVCALVWVGGVLLSSAIG